MQTGRITIELNFSVQKLKYSARTLIFSFLFFTFLKSRGLLLIRLHHMVDFSQFAFSDDSLVPVDFSNEDKISGVENKQPVTIAPLKTNTKPCIPTIDAVGLPEIYSSPNCVENNLRLILVGHNPSEKSWQYGHYYANPANRMWGLLKLAKIIPPTFSSVNDVDCPRICAMGFTDLMSGVPETKSSSFTDSDVGKWKHSLFDRIDAHISRVSNNTGKSRDAACPKVIAFAGVRQWKALFPPKFNFKADTASKNAGIGLKRRLDCLEEDVEGRRKEKSAAVDFGIQEIRPPDWPASLQSCVVFVLPSSSGAAALVRLLKRLHSLDLSIIFFLFSVYNSF